MFGPTSGSAVAGAAAAVSRKVPLSTFALFSLRDCLTVFASFNLPPRIAPYIPMEAMPTIIQKSMSSASAAQFLAPVAIQVASTPLHLLGLDLYNRPGASLSQRANKVFKEWGVSCLARMGRILPAFGVGGVVNAKVRKGAMGWVEKS